jgi:hypothetical protein
LSQYQLTLQNAFILQHLLVIMLPVNVNNPFTQLSYGEVKLLGCNCGDGVACCLRVLALLTREMAVPAIVAIPTRRIIALTRYTQIGAARSIG